MGTLWLSWVPASIKAGIGRFEILGVAILLHHMPCVHDHNRSPIAIMGLVGLSVGCKAFAACESTSQASAHIFAGVSLPAWYDEAPGNVSVPTLTFEKKSDAAPKMCGSNGQIVRR